jgi:hypothetical protein
MPKQADSTPRNVEFLRNLAEEDNQDILKLARRMASKMTQRLRELFGI